jgi:hypothetical protein
MAETNRNTKTGSAGGSDINVDLLQPLHQGTRTVTLSANYTPSYPPGYPMPPSMTGCAAANLYHGQTLTNGTVVTLLTAEANALIAAGKAA